MVGGTWVRRENGGWKCSYFIVYIYEILKNREEIFENMCPRELEHRNLVNSISLGTFLLL